MGAAPERITGGHEAHVLWLLALGTVGLLAGQIAVSPLVPTIIETFGIGSTGAGVAITIMWASAAVMMYPGGRFSDVLNRKSVLIAAVWIATAGLVLATVAPVFPLFVLGLGILGMGIGLYEPTSMAAVADLYDSARGQAYGIISASYNVGSGLASGIALAALLVGWWQGAFLPTALLLGALGVVLLVVMKDPIRIERVRMQPRSSLRRITATRRLTIIFGLFCLQMFIWQGSASFYPTILQTELSFSPTVATVSFAGIFVVGLVLSPILGWIGDQIGYVRIALLVPISGATGLATILLFPNWAGLAVGTGLFAIGLVGFWPLLTPELMNALAPESYGADYGTMRAVFYGLGSLGPTYVGAVADANSYVLAYATFIGLFCLSAIGMITLGRLR